MSTPDNKKDIDEVMLPGFRFHPTDEELVGFYLRRKVEKKPISIELIKQVDIYKYDPWDLPKISTVGDKEWYFFCIRGRKYRNSIRPNRVTGSGFWKATGIDKPIYSSAEKSTIECIGLKKSLVYYRGSAGKGTKTDWMMHEFRLPPTWKINANNFPNANHITQQAEVWTLCRIFKRTASYKKYIPEWKEYTTDATSKTYNLEHFDNNNHDMNSFVQQNERKPFINESNDRNQLFNGEHNSVAHALSTTSDSSFWNSNGGEFFKDGNWDELRSVVDLAIDPHHIYGCI